MKDKQTVEWEKELDLLVYNVAGSITDCDGMVDGVESTDFKLGSEPLKLFVSDLLSLTRLQSILEVKSKVEEYEPTQGVSQSDSYQIGQNHGRQEAKREILSTLTQMGK